MKKIVLIIDTKDLANAPKWLVENSNLELWINQCPNVLLDYVIVWATTKNIHSLVEPYLELLVPSAAEKIVVCNSFPLGIENHEGVFDAILSPFVLQKHLHLYNKTHHSIYFKVKNRLERIPFQDIEWIQARDIYAIIKTPNGRYLVSHSLKEIEEKLRLYPVFQRIQRSHIVNIDKIEVIEQKEVLIAGEYIAIGDTFKELLFAKLLLM